MKHLLLFSFLSLITVQNSIAIKCYVCQSIVDDRCNDHFKVSYSDAIIDCDLERKPFGISYRATFCRKIKQKSKFHFQISISFIPG